MKSIKLFYNSSCADCVKLAKATSFFDWLRRIDYSTEVPESGFLELGEIAVYEYKTGKYLTGIYAIRKLSLHVPVYFIYGLLLFIPVIKNLVAKDKVGCNGDVCDIK